MRNSLGRTQTDLARAGFGLNSEYSIPRFLKAAVISTLLLEMVGAAILSRAFAVAGVDNPVWQGVFHSVSAFCTAGFSLFPNSLENFKGNPLVLYSVSVLSYLGAIGFVVIAEVVDSLVRPRAHISPTSKIILKVTAGLAIFATAMLWAFEPSIHALPVEQRLDNAFFQAMTASTTVGFNSVPIGSLAPASLMIIYLLMFIGASPSGTGGGLKSSTAAVLWATAIASIAGRDKVVSSGVVIPSARVHQATATFVLAMCIIFAGVVALDLTGSYSMDKALFEVISALSTVGLSMGLTGELNTAGKLIITLVMFIGRVGILAFFLAVARRQGSFDISRLRERDVIL
jgi:trk system potassium uptake protein TrkH